MKIMKDYHDLFLKIGILFLSCVFETFIKESINSFKLRPLHYISSPSYNWDVMKKFADGIRLKLNSGI